MRAVTVASADAELYAASPLWVARTVMLPAPLATRLDPEMLALPLTIEKVTGSPELALALKIDPVKLRKMNEPKIDESLGVPFSSRHLLECYQVGAEKFGWSERTPDVGSMKKDGLTRGWGMAGASWLAARFPAESAGSISPLNSQLTVCSPVCGCGETSMPPVSFTSSGP